MSTTRRSIGCMARKCAYVAMLILAMAGCTDKPAPAPATTATDSTTDSTLGVTLDEYGQRFDAMNQSLATAYRWRPVLESDRGEVTGFHSTLSDTVSMQGLVDHGELTQVTLTVAGLPDKQALNAATATLAAGVRGVSLEQVTPTVVKLLNAATARANTGEAGFTVSHTLNGTDLSLYVGTGTQAYSVSFSE